jgi:glutathione S-transferase
MPDARYQLVGAPSSPYSLKLRAILRYRRIPHDWTVDMPALSGSSYPVRPLVLPILQDFDGGWHVDSTPIARMLEERHADRTILPPDPGTRFLCLLIEDMADEWLTKAMFHYRWSYQEDVDHCSWWLAADALPGQPRDRVEEVAAIIAQRQVERMPMVGCRTANSAVIEATYLRLLAIMEDSLQRAPFLFGDRPSLADFGLFGQLIQLATDPVPARIMRDRAPITAHWVRRADDLSGVEGQWDLAGPGLAVEALLELAGDTYLPFLAANDEALRRGEPDFTVELAGGAFAQPTFRYQAKCLAALRSEYRALAREVRERVNPILERTGCLEPIAASPA